MSRTEDPTEDRNRESAGFPIRPASGFPESPPPIPSPYPPVHATPPPTWFQDRFAPVYMPGPEPLPPHSRRHLALAGLLFVLTGLSTTFTWGPAYGFAV